MAEEKRTRRGLLPKDFVNYVFFKIRNDWLQLHSKAKIQTIQEFAGVLKTWTSSNGLSIRTYSTLGTREDAHFGLRMVCPELAPIQDSVAALLRTRLGGFLDMTHAFLALAMESPYTKDDPKAEGFKPDSGSETYMFVYPFVKTREWYLLPFSERKRIMDGHIHAGSEFPNIKINTAYAFGLDDQDFVVAFDTDNPKDFMLLVMKLREAEASRYTVRDTPMFTCVKKDIEDILKSLT